MTDSPRIAVVGAGRWGRNLVRNFHALGALAMICDGDPQTLAEHRERLPDVAVTASLADVAAAPGIDAVALATPTVTHGALARSLLEAGKSVFVEKPLCMDAQEARALGALAAARSLVLMTGHLLLFHPAFLALAAFVAAGGLGEPRYIGAQRLNFRPARSEDDALWDIAPHDVSMILALAGALPHTVTASAAATVNGRTIDAVHATLAFDSGLQASLAASWIHPYKEQRLVVAGSEGIAVFDDLQPGNRKLTVQRQRLNEGPGELVLREEAEPIAWAVAEPLANECAHFLECLRAGSTPRSDAAEALAVVRVLAACEHAARVHDRSDPRTF